MTMSLSIKRIIDFVSSYLPTNRRRNNSKDTEPKPTPQEKTSEPTESERILRPDVKGSNPAVRK